MNEGRVIFDFLGDDPVRLDKYLREVIPDISRSQLQRWIRDGHVMVNGQTIKKTGLILDRPCDVTVEIPPTLESPIEPEDIPLDIIFENLDLIVVNKPAGMVVHPAPGHRRHTLVNAALAHAPEIEGVGGVRRPGVVHRLDKDTSGVILLAKNDLTHRHLQKQFEARSVEKSYLALVDGHPPTPSGRVEAAIGRDPNQRQKMAIVPPARGREAVSEYHTQERFPEHSLIEVQPQTGRQHQIRLHMAFIGCPVVGDHIYGTRKASLRVERHCLHASSIGIQLPGEEELQVFHAPLAEDLIEIIDNLRTQ